MDKDSSTWSDVFKFYNVLTFNAIQMGGFFKRNTFLEEKYEKQEQFIFLKYWIQGYVSFKVSF